MFNCLFTQVSKAVTHLDVYCAKVLCHPLFLYIVLGKRGKRCSTLLKNIQAYMKIQYINQKLTILMTSLNSLRQLSCNVFK